MTRSFRSFRSFRSCPGLLLAALLMTASAAAASPAGYEDGLEARFGSTSTSQHDGLEVRYGDAGAGVPHLDGRLGPQVAPSTAPVAPSAQIDGLETRYTGAEAPTTATATASAERRGFDSLTLLLGLMLAAVLGAGVSMVPRGARHRRAGAH